MYDGSDESETDEFDGSQIGPDVPSVDIADLDKSTPVDITGLDKSRSLEEADADPETASLFWRLVVVFDVALFAFVAGPTLWYFEGRTTLGLQLFGLGLVAFGYGLYRLRTRTTGAPSRSGDDGSGEAPGE